MPYEEEQGDGAFSSASSFSHLALVSLPSDVRAAPLAKACNAEIQTEESLTKAGKIAYEAQGENKEEAT